MYIYMYMRRHESVIQALIVIMLVPCHREVGDIYNIVLPSELHLFITLTTVAPLTHASFSDPHPLICLE